MDKLIRYLSTNLPQVGEAAIEAHKEVITEESNELYKNIKNSTPINTGELASTLQIKEKTENKSGVKKFGFVVDYDGYKQVVSKKTGTVKEVPFSYIGRSLNRGNSKVAGTRHIDKAVSKLKGMDGRINKRFEEKIKKVDKM